MKNAWLAALSLGIAGCTSPGTPGGGAEKDSALLVRRYLEEVVSAGDVDRIDEFISPDYVETDDATGASSGLEGARAHVLGVRSVYPDLIVTVEQQITQGEWVASRIRARGTHTGEWLGMAPTGAELEFTGVNLDRVVGGRIVEHGGAANMLFPLLGAGAVQAVGVSATTESEGGSATRRQTVATPYREAAPRVFGRDVGSINFSEFLDGGVAVFGGVHVGPTVLVESSTSHHASGDRVVPVAYTYTVLKGDAYVAGRDGLHYKSARESDPLHFVSTSEDIHSEVTIFPRDDLNWGEVDSEVDVIVSASAQLMTDE